SFTTYRAALSSACPRLRDRLLSRSSNNNELNVLPHASENSMHCCLTAWDLTWLTWGWRRWAVVVVPPFWRNG
ncbi:hypothetical protein HN51_071308, partial [Arachis hypogaea]